MMAYIPIRQIIAEDPPAYFTVPAAPSAHADRQAKPIPPLHFLDQMYAYYTAD